MKSTQGQTSDARGMNKLKGLPHWSSVFEVLWCVFCDLPGLVVLIELFASPLLWMCNLRISLEVFDYLLATALGY